MSNLSDRIDGREIECHPSAERRQVSVGPVARQLSNRQPPRRWRNWLPMFLLALSTAACGFIVNAAIKNNQLWLGQVTFDAAAQPAHLVDMPVRNSGKEGHSQVRSVIELVGAFEHLAHEDAEERNPLALPQESSTTPVAFYSHVVDDDVDSAATDKFLKQINIKTDEQQVTVATEMLVGNIESDSQVVVANHSVELAEADVSTVTNSEQIESILSRDDLTEPLPAPEVTKVEKQVAHDFVVSSDVIEPSIEGQDQQYQEVAEAPKELVIAVEAYDNALASMLDNETDRMASRKYYAALAELGQATRQYSSDMGRQRIRQIYGNPQLLELASSAAASWMNWPKRHSAGIVLAGKVRSVSEHSDGYLVNVLTSDRKSSTLSVAVDSVDFAVDSERNALFFGVVTAQASSGGSPLIQAEFVQAAQ